MAVLEIIKYPNPCLRKRCKPVEEITPEILKLADHMAETMYAAPGVGLAACQVGASLQVAVIDVTWRSAEQRNIITIFNPVLVHAEGETVGEEGCLSVPNCLAEVKRSARVLVRGLDREGKEIEIAGEGLLAVALQHELDHLNGVLFFDHLSRLKREILKKKLKEIQGGATR